MPWKKATSPKVAGSSFARLADMKNIIGYAAARIQITTREARDSDEPNNLIGWGSSIESFESLLSPYLLKDKGYYLSRNKIKQAIKFLNIQSHTDRERYFRIYNSWFSLLCVKMS